METSAIEEVLDCAWKASPPPIEVLERARTEMEALLEQGRAGKDAAPKGGTEATTPGSPPPEHSLGCPGEHGEPCHWPCRLYRRSMAVPRGTAALTGSPPPVSYEAREAAEVAVDRWNTSIDCIPSSNHIPNQATNHLANEMRAFAARALEGCVSAETASVLRYERDKARADLARAVEAEREACLSIIRKLAKTYVDHEGPRNAAEEMTDEALRDAHDAIRARSGGGA